jgi:hypothetical protein
MRSRATGIGAGRKINSGSPSRSLQGINNVPETLNPATLQFFLRSLFTGSGEWYMPLAIIFGAP